VQVKTRSEAALWVAFWWTSLCIGRPSRYISSQHSLDASVKMTIEVAVAKDAPKLDDFIARPLVQVIFSRKDCLERHEHFSESRIGMFFSLDYKQSHQF
jgi:hypothetical protein